MRRGIDRPHLEQLLLATVARLVGLPADKVFLASYAPDTAAPPKPFVSVRILPAGSSQIPGTQAYVDSLELWRLEVISDDDGEYAVTVDGVEWVYDASGDTATGIRDGLAEAFALSPHPSFTATAKAAITIDVESASAGKRLVVESSSPGLRITQLRGNLLKTDMVDTALTVQLRCFAAYSSSPTALNEGVDMAERLARALLDVDETWELRDSGFQIRRANVTDIGGIVDGETELVGALDLTVGTIAMHINTNVSDAREANVTWTF